MLIVVLGASYWAWSAIGNQRLERQVAQPKEWPDGTLPALPLKYTLKTRCSEEQLYYALALKPLEKVQAQTDVEKRPRAISEMQRFFEGVLKGDWTRDIVKLVKHFNVVFSDSEDFELFQITIPSNEFSRGIGEGAEVVNSFHVNAKTTCIRGDYARATKVGVGWHQN